MGEQILTPTMSISVEAIVFGLLVDLFLDYVEESILRSKFKLLARLIEIA